jgi:hypothetical protein
MSRKPPAHRTIYDRIRAGSAPHAKPVTGWHDIANEGFRHGWSNFGGQFSPAAYFRDANGIVHLRGLIANGQIGVTNEVCILDETCRPEFRLALGTICNGDFARVDVLPTGELTVMAATSVVWVSLDGLSFRGYQIPG